MENEEKLGPIRQSVHVDCPVEEAFRLFTERFGEWWPAEDGSSFEMESGRDGKITERTRSGEERDRGTVTAWEPPDRLEFTWQQGGRVEVEFSVDADGSRVTVTHQDWHLARADMVCFAGFVREMLVAA